MALIDTFRSGDIVSLTFAFNVLDIDSASYTVRDSAGTTIVDEEPLDIAEGQMSIPVVISAEHNQLVEKERDLRYVIVKATAGGLTHEERQMYVLLNSFELSVPGQSFATVADAQMQAIDMINGDTLLADGEGLMRKRLIEATRRIKTLPFSIRRIMRIDFDRYDRPQNMLNVYDIPWGLTACIGRIWWTGNGSLRSSLRICQTTLKRRCFWPLLMRHARSPMATILRVREKTAFCLNRSVKQPICTAQAKWRMSVWPAAPGDCLLVTSTIG
jgi:hypothetical protein